MRHLIVLSGNSLKNKAWGELMIGEYSSSFDSSFMLQYGHWESGEANINFAAEQTKLANHVATLPGGTEIILFAKSAGSLLAFLAIEAGVITPLKCVFFGIPFDLAAEELFKDNWDTVTSFTLPAVAFHNVEDPTTKYEFTKDTLTNYAPHINLVTTQEADHWYGDIATYNQTLKYFL